MTVSEMTFVCQKYKEKIPAPLNTQFPDRVSKAEVVQFQEAKTTANPTLPSGIITKISETSVVNYSLTFLLRLL